MKRIIALTLAVIMALTLAACGGSSSTASTPAASSAAPAAAAAPAEAASEPVADDTVYEIRAAYDYLEDSYMGQNFQKFVDRAEELGNGRIHFTLYPSGSLYTANQALEAVQAGDLEICSVANSNIGNYSDQALVISLPFMIPNREAMDEMWDLDGELMKTAYAELPSKNFHVLGIFAFVLTDISSNFEINVPSDIKAIPFASTARQTPHILRIPAARLYSFPAVKRSRPSAQARLTAHGAGLNPWLLGNTTSSSTIFALAALKGQTSRWSAAMSGGTAFPQTFRI